MPSVAWLVILLIVALSFSFLSGINDAGNMMASMLSARAMRPLSGLILVVVMELLGPLLFGTAVAATIGRGLIVRAAITPSVIICAAIAATVWTLATSSLSLPSSMSHALLGGLLGSVLVDFSPSYVKWDGVVRVLILLFVAPPVGFVVGHGVVRLLHVIARRATPRLNLALRRVQVVTSALMIMAHAANDAQKTMGILAMGILALGYTAHFTVPLWSIVASAVSLSLGMATGGWRIARKIGFSIVRLRPMSALAAQLATMGVVLTGVQIGAPLGTTQILTSSILGAGTARSLARARWGIVRQVLVAWIITLPSAALLAAFLALLIRPLGPG
jgi:inorganic phosphate transporter, PiT family